jgi:hypothetical protein
MPKPFPREFCDRGSARVAYLGEADTDEVTRDELLACVLAHDAVRLLSTRGRPARRLVDGMLEWRLAGPPVAA